MFAYLRACLRICVRVPAPGCSRDCLVVVVVVVLVVMVCTWPVFIRSRALPFARCVYPLTLFLLVCRSSCVLSAILRLKNKELNVNAVRVPSQLMPAVGDLFDGLSAWVAKCQNYDGGMAAEPGPCTTQPPTHQLPVCCVVFATPPLWTFHS